MSDPIQLPPPPPTPPPFKAGDVVALKSSAFHPGDDMIYERPPVLLNVQSCTYHDPDGVWLVNCFWMTREGVGQGTVLAAPILMLAHTNG